jgi:hypothetical protein
MAVTVIARTTGCDRANVGGSTSTFASPVAHRPLPHLDRCSECGWKVQYHPHAPRGRRLCAECADVVIGTGAKEKVTTTPRMMEDFQTYARKKLQ